MDKKTLMYELFRTDKYYSLTILIESLKIIFEESELNCSNDSKLIELNHFDKLYFDEIKQLSRNVDVHFGKTLKEIKCVIVDEEGLREHDIYVKRSSSKKYLVSHVNLPYLPYQDEEYTNLSEIILNFKNQVKSLNNYFTELERIDRFCSVMEPAHPTYKDDYRKIYLDDRTWVHIEVAPDGSATNIHLIGRSDLWNNKLETGLLQWDHDKDIVDNIMNIFDISSKSSGRQIIPCKPNTLIIEKQICGICLCNELPDNPEVPQPLCQNNSCGVYFHRSCLYEWLVAYVGGRPPAFGLATGSCPTCLHPIACSEKKDKQYKRNITG